MWTPSMANARKVVLRNSQAIVMMGELVAPAKGELQHCLELGFACWEQLTTQTELQEPVEHGGETMLR